MIPFLTEIIELGVAVLMLAATQPFLKSGLRNTKCIPCVSFCNKKKNNTVGGSR